MAKNYSASDIEVLEGLEPVRKRPGMYIAGTDTPAGLHQLAYEILDNSVDEAMNGHASEIALILHKDGESVSVVDNGRGIPVDKHPKFKKPALELILTTLHAGGKFSDKNYATSGGLHGVGSSVVNALSEELVATVKRGGKEYTQSYVRGVPKSAVRSSKKAVRGSGTSIFFRPDAKIFSHRKFSAQSLAGNLRTKAYLNPGLKLTFIDEAENKKEEFCYEEGLATYLDQLLGAKKEKVVGEQRFVLKRDDDVSIVIALAWTETTKERFQSYVNGIFTVDGGSHENGAKSGIVRAVRNYLSVHDLTPKGVKIGAEDIREGLVCLVSVKLPGSKYQVQFQGQTKSKLNNPEVAPLVDQVAKNLEQSLNENPSTAQAVVNRIVLSAKARAASRAAGQSVRRKVGISHRMTLPGKLADCTSTKPDESELFIVEGDSAGGSTKQGRDRHYQAVLPLRGKVLNTVNSSAKKVTDNKELSNIVSALGAGVGDSFQLERCRYGKVIILTDADADGMHIGTLLMAFFFQYMRPLVDAGCLYLGKPPLYGVFSKSMATKGQAAAKKAGSKAGAKGRKTAAKGKAKKKAGSSSAIWAYSDEELDEVLGRNGLQAPRIVRYKGLGEMNPDTLWETTLDPDSRTLLRLTADDEELIEEGLQALMGSDPAARSRMIYESAELLEVDV